MEIMTKRKLIDDPNSCLNKCADDEPVVLFRAPDVFAPGVIRSWADKMLHYYEKNNPDVTAEQIRQVKEYKINPMLATAEAMEKWPKRKIPD